MSIGKRLLEIRKETKLSQADFGKLFDLSDRAYKNYELEIRELPIRTAIQICEKFNVSANWLLLGNGAITSTTLDEALIQAKEYASRYIKKSSRQFTEDTKTKLEARFLNAILDDAESAEKQFRLMEELDEI